MTSDGVSDEYESVLASLRGRWPDAMAVPTLDREEVLMDLLGSPQTGYPVIHVAGTNGKSSTTRMIDSLLRTVGLRVGRFTSPEFRLRERIALHGEAISPDYFVQLYRDVEPYVTLTDAKFPQRLTAFEVVTAMAFAAFVDAPVDVAVVEVGMGGGWDCTNVARGTVAVLTPIGLEHQDYLGDTVEAIAAEKAAIIKPGATAVVAAQAAEAAGPILERCAATGATLAREGGEFGVRQRGVAVGGQVLSLQGLGGVYDDIFLPVHGAHQAQNAAVALAAVEAFFGAGVDRQLDVEVVRAGFAAVTVPGRLERVRSAPTVLLDAAHNPHGMAATATAVAEEFAFRRLVAVVSIPADKDVAAMLELLEPAVDVLVATRNTSPRAMPAEELAALAVEVFGPDRVEVHPELPDAIEAAVALAESDTDGELSGVGVLITGSVVTVADARRLLKR